MKKNKIGTEVFDSNSTHWVGNGFHARHFFPGGSIGFSLDPFLLLDYAGPTHFPPTSEARGVEQHPHRGFETVTIVYQGSLEHRDSGGNSGRLSPGDVQWMTAASGVVHEEMHERAFSRKGGTLEMIQLWVNLPKKFKMSPPRYQTLLREQFPIVQLPEDAGSVRIIAGSFRDMQGPAQTFTPIQLYDLSLKPGGRTELILPQGDRSALLVLKGEIQLDSSNEAAEGQLAVLETGGKPVGIEALKESTILVMSGKPIQEPIASHGPFVMNTQEELLQAMRDYREGKMGRLN